MNILFKLKRVFKIKVHTHFYFWIFLIKNSIVTSKYSPVTHATSVISKHVT